MGVAHQFCTLPVSLKRRRDNTFLGEQYDRHVPLEFFGEPFIPGTYHGMVAPVDIAATFASLLRINRPSAAVGRTLTEALRTEAATSGWATDSGKTEQKTVIRSNKPQQ
jgi:hypothetical protein